MSLNRLLVLHLGLQYGGRTFSLMADVLGFVEIDNFFGDVGGMIPNSFEAFGDDHQIEAASHCDAGP